MKTLLILEFAKAFIVLAVTALLISLFAGCASPGRTTFSVSDKNGKTVKAEINGEITAEKLFVSLDANSGQFTFSADKWRSRKREVIKETYAGQVALMDSSGKVIAVVSEGVVKGMMKSVVPIP